ncbi:glycosyltransferase [Phycicoccus sp. MAQZ13P-2]|uniref:glycosyltransferase n=1 Tax=Phycicoccus mangrovi TaxID=2840470 RepID=UPI001C0038CC|nr:glycosyltransferase [Phycicoccus mangrovi]MBT9254965.1 glycosyltransferase [Phycicoccus mangrovi]MBT9256038.1 glycosyltransferase [Phycicoccus mangrovi]MBT9273949.1 glycosyltransferase [Phycicoccus mangrovi]
MSPQPPWGAAVPGNRWDLVEGQDAPVRSVGVVVLHYRQQRELDRTLHALARQDYPADAVEVVVTDDGSDPLPRVPDGVGLVTQEDRGFRAAAARNAGARRTRADVLVFLDADSTPEPSFLRAVTRLPRLLPEAVVVGRRRHADLATVPLDAPVETNGPAHELPEPAWLREAYAGSADLLHADALSFRHVISAAVACSRWWFDHVGGFDEGFTTYGGEDWEWAARAWEAGGLLAHAADATVWHDGPDAGEEPRDWGREGAVHAKDLESLAVATRVGVPGVTTRALDLGADDVVVTVPPGVDLAALVITLDPLLQAVPTARLLLGDAHAALLPQEHRVRPRPDGDVDGVPDVALLDTVGRYRRHVHVHAPAHASPATWHRLLSDVDRADAPASVTVEHDRRPLLEVRSLRALRRAALWDRPDLVASQPLSAAAVDVTPTGSGVAGRLLKAGLAGPGGSGRSRGQNA